MSFPNYPNKYESESVLTGEAMIAFRRRLGAFPKVPAPEAVILCIYRGLAERMKRKYPFRNVGRLTGDLYSINRARGSLIVAANFGIGAPMVVAFVEELIAWGVRRLVTIGWVGALQPDLKPGSLVICNRAIRDEGSSHHYLPAAKYALASESLVTALENNLIGAGQAAVVGTSWTTDAPYRETAPEVKQYQSEGVLTVEMESAALFTVAAVHGVEAASIFVVGDSLADLAWSGPKDLTSVERGLEIAYGAAIAALSPSSR